MKEQNFKNHTQFVPGFHIVGFTLVLALLAGSIRAFIQADASSRYSASLLILVSVVFIIIFWYARSFALKAQDRAIRAEENFRHFIITGKPLDKELRLSQIIALRFASDEEFPALAKKAVAEKIPAKEIKQSIQHWRGDYHRV
ncbi:MAG: hypothetical protein IPQ08_05240 [Chitinophagaceae bacterium]|nr:hypothetical protein [Chitinophagaceae bacterium]